MGINCCDLCPPGCVRFCRMCDSRDGAWDYWELIRMWHLDGCMPCDDDYNTGKWLDNLDAWWANHVMYIRKEFDGCPYHGNA
jgi:hypothetical protein